MKTLKTIIIATLSVSLLAYSIFTITTTYKINRAGGFSSVCYVGEKGRRFIIDTFGDITDTDQLIVSIENYVVDNFEYNKNYDMPVMQTFDFDSYVFEGKGKTGVCFELACFAKCCLFETFKYQNKEAKAYVLDVKMPSSNTLGSGHSYNYVIDKDRIITFDLVEALHHKETGKRWRKTFEGNSVSDIFDFSKSMNEKPYNIY